MTETLALHPPGTPVDTGAVVRLEGLTKSYQDPAHPAVADFDLQLAKGEIVALLGPSGCGKTTLLRLVAGFEVPEAGRVVIAGREVSGPASWLAPERRNIGFVFQDYALFPHLNVLQNVAFGLNGLSRKARYARAREVLALVGLTIFSRRYPGQLSGGQQQRVALARALAPQPNLILLDEPFSNLDAAQRGATREEIRRILKRTGTTALLVTHDQEEALTFADRLAVMRAGRLEQVGPPERAYLEPRTAFVASFLGTTNLLRGTASGATVSTVLGDLALSRPASGVVLVSLRPEDLLFGAGGVPVEVESRAFKGHDLTFVCRALKNGAPAASERLVVQTGPYCALQPGDRSHVCARGRAVPLEPSVLPESGKRRDLEGESGKG